MTTGRRATRSQSLHAENRPHLRPRMKMMSTGRQSFPAPVITALHWQAFPDTCGTWGIRMFTTADTGRVCLFDRFAVIRRHCQPSTRFARPAQRYAAVNPMPPMYQQWQQRRRFTLLWRHAERRRCGVAGEGLRDAVRHHRHGIVLVAVTCISAIWFPVFFGSRVAKAWRRQRRAMGARTGAVGLGLDGNLGTGVCGDAGVVAVGADW